MEPSLPCFLVCSLWNSLVTLTVLMTGANWSDSLFAGSDTVGQGLNMRKNYSVRPRVTFTR